MLASSSSLSQRIPEFVKKSAERVVQAGRDIKNDPGQSFHRMVKPAVATATAASIALTVAGSGTLTQASSAQSTPALDSAYVVQRGDYLTRIAPAAWKAVAHENHLANPNRILVGQILYVNVKQVAPRLRPKLLNAAQLRYLERMQFHSRGYIVKPAPTKPATPAKSPQKTPSHASGGAPSAPGGAPNGINNHPPAPAPSPQGNGSSAVNYCSSAVDWSRAAQWGVPNSCYGTIYTPNTAKMPYRPGAGWCNWLPEEAHLNYAGSSVLTLAKHWDAPRVGAVVWFNPGVEGAGGAGHWANLVAIGPNGWGLVEEENFAWRGGGFGRIDYRFIKLYTPGVAYLYA